MAIRHYFFEFRSCHIRAHQKEVDEGRPVDEIDRLRLEAGHLYQTVIDYQLHKTGNLDQTQN